MENISDDDDILHFFDIAAKVYRESGTLFRDMMDQLHAAAINNPDEFSDKMDEVIQLKIQAFEKTIEKGIEKGLVRNFNKTALAVMLYGIEEATHRYTSRWKLDESQRDALGKDIMDILLHGITATQ